MLEPYKPPLVTIVPFVRSQELSEEDPYLRQLKAGHDPRKGADEEDEDDVELRDDEAPGPSNPFVQHEAEVSGTESDDDDDGTGVVPPGWRNKKRAQDKKKKTRALRGPDGPTRSLADGKASDERKKKPRNRSGKHRPRRIADSDEEEAEQGLVAAIRKSSLAAGIEQMTEEDLMAVDLETELAIEAQMHAEHEARQRQTEADAARREAAAKKEERLRKMRQRSAAEPTRPGFSGINRCETCGVDMGDCNGRQLCGKFECDREFEAELSSDPEDA